MSSLETTQPSFFAFAFDYHGSEAWNDLPYLREGLPRLVEAWSPSMRHYGAELSGSSEPRAVMDAIEQLLFTHLADDDKVLIYIGGHGVRFGDDHCVVSVAAERDGPLSSRTGILASELASAIGQARPRQIAVVIDTCYSGAAAARVAAIVDRFAAVAYSDQATAVSIISSTQAFDRVADGAFISALLEVLSDPEPKLWTRSARLIAPSQVAMALHARYGESIDVRQRLFVDPMLPNLAPQAGDGETTRQLTREHFLRAASSLETGDEGWWFVGRAEALSETVSWLRDDSAGLLIVTGPPGSGKSAALGCIALLSDPVERERIVARAGIDPEAPTTPPEGSVTVALHARDKTLDGIVNELARGIEGAPGAGRDRLLAAVSERSEPLCVLVDALDEAVADEVLTIAQFLRDLADLPRVKVLVGTRPDRARNSTARQRGRRGPILSVLEPEQLIDLYRDDPHERDEDVVRYVCARLDPAASGSPYTDAETVAAIAAEVARRADGVFLYARLMVQVLLASEPLTLAAGWRERLPGAHDGGLLSAVVDADLARIPERARARVRGMLTALAWAEGEGLPRYVVWPAVASAIGATLYTDADATDTIQYAMWYLLESAESGVPVFRLQHEELVRHFREETARGR